MRLEAFSGRLLWTLNAGPQGVGSAFLSSPFAWLWQAGVRQAHGRCWAQVAPPSTRARRPSGLRGPVSRVGCWGAFCRVGGLREVVDVAAPGTGVLRERLPPGTAASAANTSSFLFVVFGESLASAKWQVPGVTWTLHCDGFGSLGWAKVPLGKRQLPQVPGFGWACSVG